MNIVIVIDLIDSLTNGSVITARRFADGLKDRGHRVKIVAVGADGEDDCPVKEQYFPILSAVSAKSEVKFAKFEREKIRSTFTGADIIHFIFPFRFEKKCKLLADEMGIPTTAAFHVQPENISYNAHLGKSRLFNSLLYRYLKRFYGKFNRIHCPSDFIANQLRAHGYGGQLYVISNGFDSEFRPAKEFLLHDKFEIIMVGRLAPEKNQKVLVSAIAKSSHRESIHLTLCGRGVCRKRLERQAQKLGVDISFEFLPKNKLIERLQSSDLYVHSASVEIEAIACLEAIACGLVPVIADSPLSATKQFALDKRSLFENNNAESLARKIDFWIENRAERIKMGKVYAEFAQRFRLERSLEQAEEMFSDEIGSKTAN